MAPIRPGNLKIWSFSNSPILIIQLVSRLFRACQGLWRASNVCARCWIEPRSTPHQYASTLNIDSFYSLASVDMTFESFRGRSGAVTSYLKQLRRHGR